LNKPNELSVLNVLPVSETIFSVCKSVILSFRLSEDIFCIISSSLDIESDDFDDDRSRHSTVDDMHINDMSEDSLTSQETLSPAINQQQVFILPDDNSGTMLGGSYDEPFQDKKTTRKLVARRNSFTQQISVSTSIIIKIIAFYVFVKGTLLNTFVINKQ
jgi:hypothetical protein